VQSLRSLAHQYQFNGDVRNILIGLVSKEGFEAVTYAAKTGTQSVQLLIHLDPEPNAMNPSSLICLAMAAATCGSQVSSAEVATSAVRALRAESNAAIAAHDVNRLRSVLDNDYHGIQGTSGELDSGGEATARSYGNEEFKDPTFITYRRTPGSIVMAQSGKRIAETGHWVGIWRESDGIMRKTGVYLAMWIPSGDTWRLKSESFVTLSCTGSIVCKQSG
jgi:hypothetical protein